MTTGQVAISSGVHNAGTKSAKTEAFTGPRFQPDFGGHFVCRGRVTFSCDWRLSRDEAVSCCCIGTTLLSTGLGCALAVCQESPQTLPGSSTRGRRSRRKPSSAGLDPASACGIEFSGHDEVQLYVGQVDARTGRKLGSRHRCAGPRGYQQARRGQCAPAAIR